MPILDLLRILDFLAMHLQAKVSDFNRDGRWILNDRFQARFLDLCFRIGKVVFLVRRLTLGCFMTSRRSPDGGTFGLAISFTPHSIVSCRLLLDRLPTKDRLCRSGFQLASRCSVCVANSESVDHLFLKCHLATALW
ncbi:hypothetical protein Dsin_024583 [Dipteronia sinensis]|uniref:Reverse transcriptase zinc-binding domain-containing protein n=1 Tax=Dipteronia sinensis TaxID=43782 RepID=A0AAD9ZVR2_9ROSI|nr:hypothetical protein Dsin_024583 [Dipteronia sinensis]